MENSKDKVTLQPKTRSALPTARPTITMNYCPSMKRFLVNCPGCDDIRVASMNEPLHICNCGQIFWTTI